MRSFASSLYFSVEQFFNITRSFHTAKGNNEQRKKIFTGSEHNHSQEKRNV